MTPRETTMDYEARRRELKKHLPGQTVLLMGHRRMPRNYPENVFPFRQNSHLLYFCGVNRPDVALALTPTGDILFGPPEDLDDVVWHGPHATLEDMGAAAGLTQVRDLTALTEWARSAGDVAYLMPYQANVQLWLSDLLGRSPRDLAGGASARLAEAICALRARKSADEIAEIEEALGVARRMHLASFRATRPGVRESDVAAAVQHVALAHDRAQAYNPIITVRGEVLHNNHYGNVLEAGQILLNDSGAESRGFYASDITRCAPVSGAFTPRQRDLYNVVLESQRQAIAAVKPGVNNRDVHLTAARAITEGLQGLGLMKGNVADSVGQGAHALFFPHGIGHMLGLDVHDMEDLGDVVGYGSGVARSGQFGLNFLRLARPLEPGWVITIEPGVYFIPALLDRWQSENKLAEFINYSALEAWRGFGGVRIEDDVLCTESGHRVLGPPIPKAPDEVLAAMAG